MPDTFSPGDADQSLLTKRYGAADLPATGAINEVIRTMFEHRSVRAYLPTALPDGTIETLVAAAQSAATSSNMQYWSVVAVSDPATKDIMASVASNQQHIRQCPVLLVFLADLSRLNRVLTSAGKTMPTLDYQEAFTVSAIDAALAAQNATLAAESLGLGTVYIGALRNDPERVAAAISLPPHVMAVFGLCIGYPDPARLSDIKPRLPQGAVLFHERYAPADEAAQIARYDGELSAFSKRQGMDSDSWTGRVIQRLSGTNGREAMRAAMRRLGFELK
jgi:nitroreductase